MKKVLLAAVALSTCFVSAFAEDEPVYGTTPETAKEFPANGWFVQSMEGIPETVYFKITSTAETPALWGSVPVAPDAPAGTAEEKQLWVYLCNEMTAEAFQMNEGSNAYILAPGQEYLVKINPKYTGFYCMGAPLAMPANRAGSGKYFPITIAADALGQMQSIEKGKTTWFELTVPYATQIQIKDVMTPLVAGIDQIEAIHVACPGGTNTGSLILPPYVKAGKNVIGLTATAAAEGDSEPLKFMFGYNAMVTLNCANNLLRGQSLELDVENTYPDAYYTVDRFFKVPEDGAYSFVNHGADGTLLNVGMVKVTDAEKYQYECDWTNIQTATCGDSDAVLVVKDLKKDDVVLVQSDAFGVIGAGLENQPWLKVVKGDLVGIGSVEADASSLKVALNGNTLGVESALLSAGCEVAVYDIRANKVASVKSVAGQQNVSLSLDAAPGIYMVVVYGKGNTESAKVVVK